MSTFDATVSMLELLSEKDLMVIQSVAAALLEKYEIYQPRSETQLLKRIDIASDHAEEGKVRDAVVAGRDIRVRYGLERN